MSELPRRSVARNTRLAGIPLGIAGRAAIGLGRRLAGGNREQINAELTRKAADQLFAVLGELKGGAMKLGQGLSVMEAAVPDAYGAPYREALTKLQNRAAPMPTVSVHKVLSRQLGANWPTRFRSFDDTPTASASIGQVHRAVWSDGRDVAVKVQYPGADQALQADLKTLNRMSGLFAALIPGADVTSLLAELADRTEEELDYRLEADNQRTFAQAFDTHPGFVIPRVVAVAPKVVITEWLSATPLADIIAEGSTQQRNLAGTRLVEFHFCSPALAGLLHCDPHPGNFMMTADGRLGVIDFGACAPMPNGLPTALGRIVRLASEGRYPELTELLYEIGFVLPGQTLTDREIANYLRPFTDPIICEIFHFTRNWLQRVMGPATDFGSRQFRIGRRMNLPAGYAMIVRVMLGSVGICCQLDAEAPYLKILSEWLPGFTDAVSSRLSPVTPKAHCVSQKGETENL